MDRGRERERDALIVERKMSLPLRKHGRQSRKISPRELLQAGNDAGVGKLRPGGHVWPVNPSEN